MRRRSRLADRSKRSAYCSWVWD
uniref:Uncharacterized protein n=1 Tax=Romanomermis culicivorax TaxID=13658 RepID=A0A915KDV0_ROMCU